MLGDERWLEQTSYAYEYYVEQAVANGRVPKPFESFAIERLWWQARAPCFVSNYRYLAVAATRPPAWETPPGCEVASIGGTCGPRMLARRLVVEWDLIKRALGALEEHDRQLHRIIMRYLDHNEWAFSRYGVTAEEGRILVQAGKEVLYHRMRQGALESIRC